MSLRSPFLLHHLIEDAAAASPEHTAFTFRDDSLSYRELCEQAGSLASALRSAGVARGDRVGIVAGKGLKNPVAVYGVSMAGAVYVPIDPNLPAGRAAFIIEDCGIDVVITESRRSRLLNELHQRGVDLSLVVDGGEDHPYENVTWDDVAVHPSPPPDSTLTELDVCYILYTSGSTGTPKGIAHTHRSALSWANVSAHSYALSAEDRISNCGPLHFDQSTLDYFSSARAGATTVIVPEERMIMAASLVELIESTRITVLYTVPTTLVRMAVPELLDGRNLESLRLVLFGGEPMPSKHLQTLMSRLPQADFFNIYGPTEVNGVTHQHVGSAPEAGDPPPPIGKPYDNVELLIADEAGTPVDPGDVGELYVKTPTMMAGYWNRTELTSSALFLRPREGLEEEVYHKTGDLVQATADGTLEFHGRRDRQIKTRGFRVELDEVETALLSHPDVIESAVYPTDTEDSGVLLHASVVLKTGSSIQTDSVIQHLRAQLPGYAVPQSLTVHDDFPRTLSGKIDRLALDAQRMEPESNKAESA